MINVERLDCPDVLKLDLDVQSDGEVETRDAIEFFADAANHDKAYRRTGVGGERIKQGYEVYSRKAIRKLLLTMFHGKCAYCESRISAVYGGDIEHFRPKGKIQDANPSKPGYFWLAADWDNLLFACPFCNQTNSHEYYENETIIERTLGKLDQFPLVSEANRLNHTHGALYLSDRETYKLEFEREESDRLLINPCKDVNVEKYFKYEEDGAIVVGNGLQALEKRKAQASIKVYALHRLTLTTARAEKIIQIKSQIKRVETAITNYNTYMSKSDEERIWFEGIMREELLILKKFTNSDQEYAGMARYIIDKYFDEARLK